MSLEIRKVLIITGGRSYHGSQFVYDKLHEIDPDLIIHGGATGADTFANTWAKTLGKPRTILQPGPDDYKRYGDNAPKIRNGWLIDLARHYKWYHQDPDNPWEQPETGRWIRAAVFPGHEGTADMFERCRVERMMIYDFTTEGRGQENAFRPQ